MASHTNVFKVWVTLNQGQGSANMLTGTIKPNLGSNPLNGYRDMTISVIYVWIIGVTSNEGQGHWL